MSLPQLSVEEYLRDFPFNDNSIPELLALNSTPSDPSVDLFTDNTCSPFDRIDFTGKIENNL
jgi:hypothetical protein